MCLSMSVKRTGFDKGEEIKLKFLPGILIIIAAMTFTGCSPNVEFYEIEALARACERHGGIHRISTWIQNSAVCRDGVHVLKADERK